MSTLNAHALALAASSPVTTLLRLAIEEDLGSGDITSQLVVPTERRGRARIVAKDVGVIAGLRIALRAFALAGVSIETMTPIDEGTVVEPGRLAAELTGPARGLLAVERVALNVLQRLSGIATMTKRYVDAVRGYPVQILETRKTVPGWRLLDKFAVRAGGGQNHRMGLFDQILVKENHFALAEPPGAAVDFKSSVERLMAARPSDRIVEVEVESLAEFKISLEAGADIIMLDDMTLEEMRTAVAAARSYAESSGRTAPLIEASGGITLENIRDVASTGVDRISIGALTHSVRALDISMKTRPE